MCGIVGYIGKNKCLPILIDGLKKLEYRGYDSAGIAYNNNGQIDLVKSVGRIKDLEKKINLGVQSYIGIGHTRWATHGKVSEINSHPHICGDVVIVHNGIIENYLEIKTFLEKQGYSFYGETDTEVAAGYIDYLYKRSKNKDILEILDKCIEKFHGSYAIVIMIKSINDKLFVIKKDSPLIILKNEYETFISSDICAYSTLADDYIVLNDLEIGVISNNNISIYKNKELQNFKLNKIEHEHDDLSLNGFSHYMFKEIDEESSLVLHWNNIHLENLDNLVDLSNYSKIHVIGCGTAYHAGLVGKYLIEKYGNIEVQVFIASEYRYQKLFIDENTLVIAISQSGETADTLACVKKVKELGAKTLGIINIKNSSIARLVDTVIYSEAGREVAVASTKAYMSQIYIFSLLAIKLGLKNNLLDKSILLEYEKLSNYFKDLMDIDYINISKILAKQDKIFYIGRGIDYASMMEGALKIKEISYISSESYASGELKHGTISLIEDGTCVVASITDPDIASKTVSNIVEVKSRGAYVILIVSKDISQNIDNSIYDELIVLEDIHDILRPMLVVLPLQLIAYYTALVKGCDIDKPRNLAKSVTVE